MGLPSRGPEPRASTNSATSAGGAVRRDLFRRCSVRIDDLRRLVRRCGRLRPRRLAGCWRGFGAAGCDVAPGRRSRSSSRSTRRRSRRRSSEPCALRPDDGPPARPPLRRASPTSAHSRGAAHARVADRDDDPGCAASVALQGRARRARRPRSPFRARDSRASLARRSGRASPTALAASTSAGLIGADRCGGRHSRRRARDQDRDRRRRRRPVAPVLQPGRLHDAARLPEGQHRVHDRQGDRRPRVLAAEQTWKYANDAVRPGVVRARDARRGDRGRRLTPIAIAGRGRSRASRRTPTSATTRC